MAERGKNSNHGLASADEETRRRVSQEGGHASGGKFQPGGNKAQRAGHEGGETASENRGHMYDIGRKGGKSSHSESE